MKELLAVCPVCGKSEWLSEVQKTADAFLCYCESGYDRNVSQMVVVNVREWDGFRYRYGQPQK